MASAVPINVNVMNHGHGPPMMGGVGGMNPPGARIVGAQMVVSSNNVQQQFHPPPQQAQPGPNVNVMQQQQGGNSSAMMMGNHQIIHQGQHQHQQMTLSQVQLGGGGIGMGIAAAPVRQQQVALPASVNVPPVVPSAPATAPVPAAEAIDDETPLTQSELQIISGLDRWVGKFLNYLLI